MLKAKPKRRLFSIYPWVVKGYQTTQQWSGFQKSYDHGSAMSVFKSPALWGKGNAQFSDGSFAT